MSSSIKWDSEGNLGHVAHVGPYTLFVVQMAVISTAIEILWGVCERDSAFLTSKGFGVDRPGVLVQGKETLPHSAKLLGGASDQVNSLVATCMQKSEEAFRKIDATRLAEEILLMDSEPSTEEIKKFLEVFNRLAEFEGQQRLIRGYAVFKADELPIEEVQKVMSWLNRKAYDE